MRVTIMLGHMNHRPGGMEMVTCRVLRSTVAFYFEHVRIEMLLRHLRVGVKGQLYMWIWSSEDIYGCKWCWEI